MLAQPLEATHRERVEAQSRMADLRHHLDRAEAERDGARTEVSILREAEARATAQAATERVARQSAEASWQAAETELDRARGELAARSMGGPVARAWRAFLNRRERP
jgi:phage shock protein A